MKNRIGAFSSVPTIHRMQQSVAGSNPARRIGEAGWLHILRRDGPTWSPKHRRIEVSAARIGAAAIDFGKVAADFAAAVRPEALDRLAAALGVSAASLRRLSVGWSARHRAWTWPMRSAAGDVLGIRLRRPDGRKLAIRGGKEGLFIPEGLVAGTLLLVAEGPTDTAALLDLGFEAVGRPCCMGGVALLVEFVRRSSPSAVAIVADADPPGQRGAAALGRTLAVHCSIRIITPPDEVKDAREWVRSGAKAADVAAAIDAAKVCRVSVSARIRGKAGKHHGR